MKNDKKIESLAHNIAKDPQNADALVVTIKSAMIRLTANTGQYLDDAIELSNRVRIAADSCTDAKAATVLEDVATAILALPVVPQQRADRAVRDAKTMDAIASKEASDKDATDKDTGSSVTTVKKRSRLGE